MMKVYDRVASQVEESARVDLQHFSQHPPHTMLTPLTSPPNFITPEDYDQLTSSTPAEFDRNPPILRFHDEQVEVSMSPVDGFEGWNGKVAGKIWVTESCVCAWGLC